MTNKLRHNSFALSVLLHTLLFLSMTLVIVLQPAPEKQERSPQLYVPSYVYKGSITPSHTQTPTPQQQHAQRSEHRAVNDLPTQAHGTIRRSIMDLSRDVLRQDQFEAAMRQQEEPDPILLVGDNTMIADPLVRLIGRSLSAHFNYPKLEGSLGTRGKVIVSVTLQPDGHFTDVQIIKSSDIQAFDSAALYAVNTAPIVPGANRFISKPKHMTVGFIFG